MKKHIIVIFILICNQVFAQISLESVVDSASTFNVNLGGLTASSQLAVVKFEVSGERYVRINRWAKSVSIYDMNHSLVQSTSLASLPLNSSFNTVGDVLYLSENLFDLDNGYEFMYVKDATAFSCYTAIVNDDGTILFSDTASPLIRANFPSQQYPIYNTSVGTKMILSYSNAQAKVFSLPGTLTTATQLANQNLAVAQGLISNPFPNPTINSTRIDYALPNGVLQAEIFFYNEQGIAIKMFKVDNAFDHLLISTNDVPSGTYYYRLQTNGVASGPKKLVVIK